MAMPPYRMHPSLVFAGARVEFALERTQTVPVDLDEAFAFFGDPRNLETITPPWLRFRVLEAPARLDRGSRLRYRLRLFGWPIRWDTEITDWHPPRSFTDVQLSGPYPLWEHTHRLSTARSGTEIHDHVRYRVPGGPLASLVQLVVRRWLDGIFDYRAERMRELLG
jgi:ligand-binding SRPBCC domain-containing protein